MQKNVHKFVLLPPIKDYFTINPVQILICLLFIV